LVACAEPSRIRNLFGEGHHPEAERFENAAPDAGKRVKQTTKASQLGRVFAIYRGNQPEFTFVPARPGEVALDAAANDQVRGMYRRSGTVRLLDLGWLGTDPRWPASRSACAARPRPAHAWPRRSSDSASRARRWRTPPSARSGALAGITALQCADMAEAGLTAAGPSEARGAAAAVLER